MLVIVTEQWQEHTSKLIACSFVSHTRLKM